MGAAKATGGVVGEVATVDEASWRPPCLADLANLADLGAEASSEGGVAAAAARATAGDEEGDEEGGGLAEASGAAFEPLRAYEQTKRRIPSWCHSAYSHGK